MLSAIPLGCKIKPVQLDLFAPVQEGYEFKVILADKTGDAGKVAHFHEGQGYQEKICPDCAFCQDMQKSTDGFLWQTPPV